MTALADAYARALAPAPGAKPKIKKSSNAKSPLSLTGSQRVPAATYEAIMQRAAEMDNAREIRSDVDLGFGPDPAYRHAKDKGMAVIRQRRDILATSRLARPGPGKHTKAFAKTAHGVDMSRTSEPTFHNYQPERVKVPLSLLVRRMMQERRA